MCKLPFGDRRSDVLSDNLVLYGCEESYKVLEIVNHREGKLAVLRTDLEVVDYEILSDRSHVIINNVGCLVFFKQTPSVAEYVGSGHRSNSTIFVGRSGCDSVFSSCGDIDVGVYGKVMLYVPSTTNPVGKDLLGHNVVGYRDGSDPHDICC